MRYIRSIGLIVLLLITACGQPGDLSSPSRTAEAPSAISVSASAASRTTAANVQPVPCPTFAAYPAAAPDEIATPTSTPPPTPTVDPENMPTGTAPGGLASITLPSDDATMRGIFAALPETIDDYRRSEDNNSSASSFYAHYYAPGFDSSNSQPGLSIEALGGVGEKLFPGKIGIFDSDPWRRNGQVSFAYNDQRFFEPLDDQRQDCRENASVRLAFVIGESPWLFSAQAPTREEIDLLVTAFVQAVKASPAPIPYSTPTPAPMATPLTGYPGFSIPVYPPPRGTMLPTTPTATPTVTTTPVP